MKTLHRVCVRLGAATLLLAASVAAGQTTDDPFSTPIPATEDVITVGVAEFASLPFVDGQAARMMRLVDEPGTGRLFVNDMRGLVYTVSYDGGTVTRYLDLTEPGWALDVEASRRERGFQSFAVHPQFGVSGAPGFGKLYTYTDTSNTGPPASFVPNGGSDAQDTILLEWTAADPGAAVYDGGPPRELLRVEQPFRNHNGGQLGFNPLAAPGDPDFGLLYIGSADGGSGEIRSTSRRTWARSSARSCASIRSAPTAPTASTAFRPTTRSRATTTPAPSARSTPTGSVTRSASRGTRGTATCSSPTSARTSSRR